MACDMPELCTFSSLVSFQKRFLWAQEEVDLAPHLVVGLALQVGDAEKFPQKLCFESLDPFFFSFFRVSKQSPCFTAIEDGSDKRLAELELAFEVDSVAPPDPV